MHNFEDIFDELMNSWARCKIKLDEFQVLFSNKNKDNFELLKAIAGGGFLGSMLGIFWDDLTLAVCRLTDKPITGRKENLTIKIIPHCLCMDENQKLELENLILIANETTQFARDWRNRRISHADLWLSIDANPEPLATATIHKMKTALAAIHNVLNYTGDHFLDRGLWRDEVCYTPMAGAFISYAKQLVNAVKYIDSIIDPTGRASITDMEVANAFLDKVGQPTNFEYVKKIFELREAAHRFN